MRRQKGHFFKIARSAFGSVRTSFLNHSNVPWALAELDKFCIACLSSRQVADPTGHSSFGMFFPHAGQRRVGPLYFVFRPFDFPLACAGLPDPASAAASGFAAAGCWPDQNIGIGCVIIATQMNAKGITKATRTLLYATEQE